MRLSAGERGILVAKQFMLGAKYSLGFHCGCKLVFIQRRTCFRPVLPFSVVFGTRVRLLRATPPPPPPPPSPLLHPHPSMLPSASSTREFSAKVLLKVCGVKSQNSCSRFSAYSVGVWGLDVLPKTYGPDGFCGAATALLCIVKNTGVSKRV